MSLKLSHSIIEISTETDDFLDAEYSTNPYLRSPFLKTLETFGYSSLSLFIFHGSVKKAFVHIPFANSDFLHDLVVYSGITFAKPQANQNNFQYVSEKHQISEYVAAIISEMVPSAQFNFHPSVIDMRAWQWFNYDKSLRTSYIVSTRYTSMIHLDHPVNNLFNQLSPQMGSSRRQEYRKSIKSSEIFKSTESTSSLLEAYLETLSNQNQYRSPIFVECLQHLFSNLIKSKMATGFEILSSDGDFLASSYWMIAQHHAIYFWGSTSTSNRSSSAGTRLIIDSIESLSEQSIKYFDLEGVNSPKRGWFKLSLGSCLVPYYCVEILHAG